MVRLGRNPEYVQTMINALRLNNEFIRRIEHISVFSIFSAFPPKEEFLKANGLCNVYHPGEIQVQVLFLGKY